MLMVRFAWLSKWTFLPFSIIIIMVSLDHSERIDNVSLGSICFHTWWGSSPLVFSPFIHYSDTLPFGRTVRLLAGVFDDAVPASDLARRASGVSRHPQRHAQPQTVRPDVDARRVYPKPQVGQFPHHHRAEPPHPAVARRHDPLQPASHADARLRYDARQVPDGQPDVQDRVRQL